MKRAILTLNRASVTQAKLLNKHIDADIYTMEKYLEPGLKPLTGGLKKNMEFIFNNYDLIIGIMAMGIIVREISPYIKHKSLDPGILCMTLDGQFIIPVLSGHLGGANEEANSIALKIGATPVITTATDILNKKAVDMIAKEEDLIIDSFKDAMEITSKIVNNEHIEIVDDRKPDGFIYIGNKLDPSLPKPVAKLITKNLILGIGARRDSEYEKIRTQLERILSLNNLDIRAINKIASIDLKSDEKGIIELSKQLNIPFETYSCDQLNSVADRFEQSKFVKKITGVGAVCMPSGFLGSNRGRCLVEKVAESGITISIWEQIK